METIQALLVFMVFVALVFVAAHLARHELPVTLVAARADWPGRFPVEPHQENLTAPARHDSHESLAEPTYEGSAERATLGLASLDPVQRRVAKKYRRLVPTTKRSFQSICFPKKFELSAPQKFVGSWLSQPGKSSPRELIAFHGIGSGKTCAAIQAILAWLGFSRQRPGQARVAGNSGRPMVVAPASLLPGFRAELRGPCAGDRFCSPSERAVLADVSSADYNKVLAAVDARIDEEIILFSYNKFLDFLRGKMRIGRDTPKTISVPLLVIDEAHNFCNLAGNYHKQARDFIASHPSMRVLLMTATPIYDKPEDLLGLLSLARRDISAGAELLEDEKKLAEATRGLVSYYAGAPPSTYPETTIKYSVCVMSAHQTRWYLSQVERELRANGKLASREVSNDFYCASRGKSIVVFRDGVGGASGLAGMKKRDLLVGSSAGSSPGLNSVGETLAKYSCKLQQLVARLKSGKLSFIYSNFAGPNGVQFIVKVLRANGWKEYTESGPGRSFAIFSGEETAREKGRLRETFNSPANDGGKKIQVVIGSPAIKEGVSFFRIRQVHILDPYWNYSRIEQVYGRASRYCSHKSLPAEKRKVSVYIYVACVKSARGLSFKELVRRADPRVSVDALILGMAEKKLADSRKIMKILVASSIDRGLKY